MSRHAGGLGHRKRTCPGSLRVAADQQEYRPVGETVAGLHPVMNGWNYTVRLYQPEPELLDGSWTFPALDQLR
jgi:hypothetical protein